MRRALLLLGVVLTLLAPASAAAAGRLDTLAAQLRQGPLAVDDDVVYLLSPAERRSVTRALAASSVPMHVALLPALDEDESGGDQARQLRGLSDRLDEPGVYIAVDERGGMEVATVRVPRDVTLDFSLIYGGSSLDDDEEPGERTVAQRLQELTRVIEASPAGKAEGFDATSRVRPLAELREEEGDGFWGLAAAFAIGGVLAGAGLWLLTLMVAAIVRGVRA